MNKKKGGSFKDIIRVIKLLKSFYPVLLPLIIFCIVFSAIISSIPSLFIQKIIEKIQYWQPTRDWASAQNQILPLVFVLIGLYILSFIVNDIL